MFCIIRYLFRYGTAIFILLLPEQVQAQDHGLNLMSDPGIDPEIFEYCVKQFDEFTERFNYNLDYTGREIGKEDDGEISRETVLASLFDHTDPRLLKNSKGYSKKYELLVLEFINAVCRDSLYLDKRSEDIYASAETKGIFNDRTVNFNIILRQEKVEEEMLKWVIRDVEAGFLEFLVEDTLMLRFLPPSSGELDFKELLRAMQDLDHLHYYAHQQFAYDPVSVLFYLLNSGEMEIELIQSVKYIIYDLPGWCITLEDFNRTTRNSGWLIKNISKVEFYPGLMLQ